MRPYANGESLNNIIGTAIPGFVSTEYPLFMEFLQAFVRFLEDTEGPAYKTRKFLDYRDISTTLDEFVPHFLDMFAKKFPQYPMIPRDLFVRSLREFYQNKGTKESIEWFFRAVYNKQATIYYPREDVLRASDSKWSAPLTLKVTAPTNGANSIVLKETYFGQRVSTVTGSALVEAVANNVISGIDVNELTLKSDSIEGYFLPGQTLTNENAPLIPSEIMPVISAVTVLSGGSGYAANDEVIFVDPTGQGTGATAQVESTTSSALMGVDVISGGDGYIVGQEVLFTSLSGSGAAAEVAEVSYGDLLLEDSSGYIVVEQATEFTQGTLMLEDKNMIPLGLTIESFLDVEVNAADYSASGVSGSEAWSNTSPIELVLNIVNWQPFMHPWVFTGANTVALANAAIKLTMHTGTDTVFANGEQVFRITSPLDVTTTNATSTCRANVIVSDLTSVLVGEDKLFLDTVSNAAAVVVSTVWKQIGTGVEKAGTVTTQGANVTGTGTLFATTCKANTQVRFSDGTTAVVASVANDIFMTLHSTVPALEANTYAVIPTGVCTRVVLQSQPNYGKIKSVLLTNPGADYARVPGVTVDSVTARAQAINYWDGSAIQDSTGVSLFVPASLLAIQSAGGIKSVRVLTSGTFYSVNTTAYANHSGDTVGTEAVLQPVFGALTQYPGAFTSNDSFLSSNKYLQNAEYYNDYTYVVRTDAIPDATPDVEVAQEFLKYKKLLLALIHPAGFQVVGEKLNP